jgi:flagellin-like protein
MSKSISGPVGVIIIVAVVLAAVVFGYKFIAGPSKVNPEDTRRMMNAAQGSTEKGHATKSGQGPFQGGSPR